MKKIIISFLLLVGTITFLKSQDVSWLKGDDLKYLKKTGNAKIEFRYELEQINDKQTEAEFIAEQKEARNSKNPGMGDKWEKEWYSFRSFLFNSSFETECNKYLKGEFQVSENPKDYSYKIIVHVKKIRTGKDNKISTLIGQEPAGGDFQIDVLDKSDRIISSFVVLNVKSGITPRNDDNFFPWINQMFVKSGKVIANIIRDKM
jgi:hypothetical protein